MIHSDDTLTNTRRAFLTLREMIVTGKLAAGTDHLESELAEALEMSRTPVREAVLALEERGLLTVRPRKGVRILPVSPEDMAEIYDILTGIECLAAERAAEAAPDAADLAALGAAITDMDAALGRSNLDEWAAADERFHRELVRLGGNRRALSIFDMLSDQVARARHTTLHMRPLPSRSNDDHRAVHAAISAGDPVTAMACHRAHRQYAKTMLVRLLETHRLRSL